MTILAINESAHNDDDDTLLCGFFTAKDGEWDKFKTVRIHPDALIFVKESAKETDHDVEKAIGCQNCENTAPLVTKRTAIANWRADRISTETPVYLLERESTGS
ncbi:hypothetical protein A2389_02005 [Candidatus Adlerbacteria bacterium RIFOXYB1_FULL_48_10]|nr:MAG: hypothetical protein A2389_02005 [Candidatus Adlerbacteria bacterium RIFOXYB1_FULL_48_10]